MMNRKKTLLTTMKHDFSINRTLYLLAIPVLVFFFLFHYMPMYGVIIAFKRYVPARGILGSPWVGLEHFRSFMSSYYFVRLFRNTILINVNAVVFGFPAPIILALLINEVRRKPFKRVVQTISYVPHFVSTVVVAGIIIDFTRSDGFINQILSVFGAEPTNLLMRPEYFRAIYVGSGIWQEIGFQSIIYLAAISAINPELYESAYLDGAGRFNQVLHITIPGIMPTIIILLILRIGNMMNVGFEKIILLYHPITYETADVISSFVYRKGLLDADYSYSTAIGLFNSIINFFLLIGANAASKRVNGTSLW